MNKKSPYDAGASRRTSAPSKNIKKSPYDSGIWRYPSNPKPKTSPYDASSGGLKSLLTDMYI